ncbi:MAG: hypothetical protein AAGC46_09500 [Solirubrobacteraceae bacterium]|nr:hypothetical protein [Patulibacter sp.]
MSPVPRTSRARALVVALASASLSFAAGAAPASADVVHAPSAAAFRDSIGVQTHLDFVNYPDANSTGAQLGDALRALGVRHVRDNACRNVTAGYCDKTLAQMTAMADTFAASGGPKVGFILNATSLVNASKNTRADRDAAILKSLTWIRDTPGIRNLTEGIEMVNEPDLRGGSGWAAQTIADAQTFERLLASPDFASLKDIPLLAPPLGHQNNATAPLLAAGWTKDLAGVSNLHAYPSVNGTPETTGIWNKCPDNGTITVLQCAQQLAPSEKTLVTEAGYSTTGDTITANWVNGDTQATYILRLLLSNFNAGIPRTYLYELSNLASSPSTQDQGFGLYYAQATGSGPVLGTPKQSGKAIANLNAEIGDLGSAAVPGDVNLTVTDPSTGAALGNDVIDKTILRRADGSYALAVWQPALSEYTNSWSSPSNITVPAKSIRVSLDGSQGGWNATSYHPVDSNSPVQSWSNTATLDLSVNDDVTLIDLQPPAGLRGTTVAEPTPSNPPGTTVPEGTIPGTTIITPTPVLAPIDQSTSTTAPSTDAQRLAGASQTGATTTPAQARARAVAARERANRLARARSRAHRAYAACLDRQVAAARRHTRTTHGHPRPTRPTSRMRALCGRWLAR